MNKVPDDFFTAPVISLHNADMTYKTTAGPVEILKNVNLQVERGVSLAITGPSGSGKTTLLMLLAGLEAATSGTVRVMDQDLSVLDEDELARFRRDHIGIVFQGFHLIAAMTAKENVAVPLEFKQISNPFESARRSLERVGLGHRLDHYPGQLSGGEQQRVAIARAIAAGAGIILADEPTGNLDGETGSAVIDLLFDLHREDNATLLLVTHDLELAGRCQRICEIRDGQIHENAGAQT